MSERKSRFQKLKMLQGHRQAMGVPRQGPGQDRGQMPHLPPGTPEGRRTGVAPRNSLSPAMAWGEGVVGVGNTERAGRRGQGERRGHEDRQAQALRATRGWGLWRGPAPRGAVWAPTAASTSYPLTRGGASGSPPPLWHGHCSSSWGAEPVRHLDRASQGQGTSETPTLLSQPLHLSRPSTLLISRFQKPP